MHLNQGRSGRPAPLLESKDMKMNQFKTALATGLMIAATSAVAQDFTLGDLTVDHPMAFETAATAKTGGGYLTITNTGAEPDRLMGVRADFPQVMIHQTEDKDGIATMSHVEAIDIPAGETVALEPGGYHVMFMGLDGDPFEVGESIPATLIFEKAGELEIVFTVQERM